MTRLVHSLNSVEQNILAYRNFVDGHPDLLDRLSKHRAWYAIRKDDVWHFGNSKIVGYADLTPHAYLSGDHDGRQTEVVLQKWFVEVGPGHPQHDQLWEALGAFLADYGKTPSKLARINVPKSELSTSDRDRDDVICELILEVAKDIDTENIKTLRKQLKTLL